MSSLVRDPPQADMNAEPEIPSEESAEPPTPPAKAEEAAPLARTLRLSGPGEDAEYRADDFAHDDLNTPDRIVEDRWDQRDERFAEGVHEIVAQGAMATVRGVTNLDELGPSLIKLCIVKEDHWRSARAAGDNLDAILDYLENAWRADDDTDPVLTQYQSTMIRGGFEANLRFAHFVLLDPLGDGGMGEVFRARNLSVGDRTEAIKKLKLKLTDDPSVRKRFEREARMMANLEHKRLPKIYHHGVDENVPYISMEYIPGDNLQTVVDEAYVAGKPVPVQTAVKWTIAIAEVLAYAHGKKVVHRDVKPANIMMSKRTGGLKLLDLGLGRLVKTVDGSSMGELTLHALILGSPPVMSPEQWNDPARVGATSDIYSLGCCLFYFLTGRFPFTSKAWQQLREAHLHEPPPSLAGLRPDVPSGLKTVLLRALAKSPDARPQSCDDLIKKLQEFSQAATITPAPAILSLRNWPSGLNIRTTMVGDRRESPPHTSADILARSASTGDLSYFGELGIQTRIRSDKIIHIARPDALGRELGADILVIGSPAANMVARVVNRAACFRFVCTSQIRALEQRFEEELEPIKFRREKLEEYLAPTEENWEKLSLLNHMLNHFAQAGFVDPIDYKGLRGTVRKGSIDFGVVTLCRNPWDENGVAILAAGVGGPATAAALKLLSRPNAFDRHPLGGVFKVQISQEAPWEERYDMLYPTWDTHDYDLQTYLDGITRLTEDVRKGDVSKQDGLLPGDADEIRGLIELLRKRKLSK